MRHAKGFKLLDLVVILGAVVILVFIFMPSNCGRNLGMAHRAACAGNLNSIYKGVVLYQQNNDQAFPMLPGNNWDTTPQGTNYLPLNAPGAMPPYDAKDMADWQSSRSVTAIMFLLVRDGQGWKLFNCPADSHVKPDPTPQTSVTAGGITKMQFNWDFSPGARHVSYSFQCPLARGKDGTDPSGIGSLSDENLVIASDRAPGKSTDMNYMSGWNSSLTRDAVRKFNSQNHFDGELNNILYAGGNVASQKTPNCGVEVGKGGPADCIFTAKDNTASSDKELRECGGAFDGVQDNRKHKGKNDSYLAGGRD